MGTSVQKITDTVSLIASKESWIEGLAVQQLINTSKLDGMQFVAGMPDLHPGKGYPIGAAFFSENRIYPALVGNDIGCGMGLWQTSIKLAKLNVEKLAKRLSDVERPLDDSWNELINQRKQELNLGHSAFDSSLGTIGSGNHFCEFQSIEETLCADSMQMLGIEPKQLLMLVHSGSRGLGQNILTEQVKRFGHKGIEINDPASQEYFAKHDHAVRWAELNRELIARRFLEAVRAKGRAVLDLTHNMVLPQTVNNIEGFLHRKGASPSNNGFAVVPGSRGDYSYLVKPKDLTGLPEQERNTLLSIAHGAGRKWRRSDCMERLSHKYRKQDLYQTTLGSRVICGNKELLYEEAPQAYKHCEQVVKDMQAAGLLDIVARLKPVLTFKTQGEKSK